MANTVIQLKKSGTPSSTPASLANGELAINYADGKLFYKAANGSILEFNPTTSSNYFGTVNANSTLLVADTIGDVLTIAAGNNITIVGDAINDRLTISLKDDVIIPSTGTFKVAAVGNDEGGEIKLGNAITNSVLTGDIIIDVYQDKLRFFESGGTNRGAFINLAAASSGVGSDLLAGGGGTTDTTARTWAGAAFGQANLAYAQANSGGTASVNVGNTVPGSGNTQGKLWWNSDLGTLLIYYDDGTSAQWVEATGTSSNITSVTGIAVAAYNQANAAYTKANTGGGGATVNVGNTLPSVNTQGTLWWNTDLGKLFISYNDGDSTQWVDATSVGDTGPTGPTGPAGPAATISVGTTTTGAPGTSATVTNSGNSSVAVFNFTIPRGNIGNAGTITVGTVTNGAPGSSVIVTNSGNSTHATLNFTIPIGNVGNTGPQGVIGNTAPRAVAIEFPQANDLIPMFYNYESFSLAEIRSVVLNASGASDANAKFTIRYGTSLIGSSNSEIITGGTICTNTTNGLSNTTFTNGTIPANNYVWVSILSATANTNMLHINMR